MFRVRGFRDLRVCCFQGWSFLGFVFLGFRLFGVEIFRGLGCLGLLVCRVFAVWCFYGSGF